MKRPDAWWLALFQRLYGKEGNPKEIKQLQKSYYVPDWGEKILNFRGKTPKHWNKKLQKP